MKLLVLLICLLLIISCSSKPYTVTHNQPFTNKGLYDVYIASHGWHTGFVIPADRIKKSIPELSERFPNTPYIEFGWGDKGFYQAKEITSGLTLKAIFWPTESVVHAVAAPEDVRAFFRDSEVEKICLNKSELDSLISFISGSFLKNEKTEITPLKKGIYGNSQFYQGSGNYHLMNTCNKWTAKGLKSIGLDINPTFKLTAGSIIQYIRKEKLGTNKSCYEIHRENKGETGEIPLLN